MDVFPFHIRCWNDESDDSIRKGLPGSSWLTRSNSNRRFFPVEKAVSIFEMVENSCRGRMRLKRKWSTTLLLWQVGMSAFGSPELQCEWSYGTLVSVVSRSGCRIAVCPEMGETWPVLLHGWTVSLAMFTVNYDKENHYPGPFIRSCCQKPIRRSSRLIVSTNSGATIHPALFQNSSCILQQCNINASRHTQLSKSKDRCMLAKWLTTWQTKERWCSETSCPWGGGGGGATYIHTLANTPSHGVGHLY